MDSKKQLIQKFRLYAVTDLKETDQTVVDKIGSAYAGGADIAQLRSKCLSDAALLKLGRKAKAFAEKHVKLLFVNDRVDLALAIGADGVHVGQNDLPVAEIRRLAKNSGRDILVGKSTHNLEQALEAEAEGVDYIGVGPVYATPTKQGKPPVGLELVRQVNREIKIPFVAIGGIDEYNVCQVMDAGAIRIAVVRAIFASNEVEAAARKLSKIIREGSKQHV